ncbi:hypothetical protein JOF56_009634 [Kibdelosporangium banguiense]|uniref:7 transmembrane helices usually fused to an inactive transglutaminase domain-containing protein n=1 Tax=Kibdelosporangium banguiense TaxID=1365924 RepID=A0ABS4TXY7_9PSEU|nr:7TM domain-containing protein [Kibdelosporangium banguiense]MBP2329249.1 hypothetical protein [Kibdelosporangium banguiense]
MAGFPAVVKVVAVAIGAVVLAGGLLFSPDRSVNGPNIIGEQELVRVVGPLGKTAEVKAIIDSGAGASSMDTQLAENLGFDLDEAPRVTVTSSLGKERRPQVEAKVKLAGLERSAKINVNDRSRRDAPVLIGRAELVNLQVRIGKQMLTTPDGKAAPNSLGVLLTPSPSIGVESLLALLPLAVLLMVVLRVWIGINTLGTFSPVLLALGYTQTGLVAGLITTMVMVAVGFAAQALLHLPRVARLAVLVGIVVLVLLGLRELMTTDGASVLVGASLPVVVTAVIIERLWEQWEADGVKAAAASAALTIGSGIVAALLMVTPMVRHLGENAPLSFAAACLIWSFVAGTYRGLRLTELARFSPAARAQEGAR